MLFTSLYHAVSQWQYFENFQNELRDYAVIMWPLSQPTHCFSSTRTLVSERQDSHCEFLSPKIRHRITFIGRRQPSRSGSYTRLLRECSESRQEASSSTWRNAVVNSTTDPSATSPSSVTWLWRHVEHRLRICTPSRFVASFDVDGRPTANKCAFACVWSGRTLAVTCVQHRRPPTQSSFVVTILCRRSCSYITSFNSLDDRYVSYRPWPAFAHHHHLSNKIAPIRHRLQSYLCLFPTVSLPTCRPVSSPAPDLYSK